MEKILVTTDNSANSRSAISVAIKLARQRKSELIILHVYHLLRPFAWSDHAFSEYTDTFRKKTEEELGSFIEGIYEEIEESEINYQLELVSNIDVVHGVLDYAKKHNCSYICISTRGAGTMKKLFGTHTSKLISSSPIPVLCIPSSWQLTELNHMLYASDMTDHQNELKKVVEFAKPIGASVTMMHIAFPDEFLLDKDLAEATLQTEVDYKVEVLTPERDFTYTLMEEIENAIKLYNPSVLVLFTDRSRPMFEKLIFGSNAEAYSFYGQIPLLTFNKERKK
jgi:nucleotide-binding universal stress UspA family protein